MCLVSNDHWSLLVCEPLWGVSQDSWERANCHVRKNRCYSQHLRASNSCQHFFFNSDPILLLSCCFFQCPSQSGRWWQFSRCCNFHVHLMFRQCARVTYVNRRTHPTHADPGGVLHRPPVGEASALHRWTGWARAGPLTVSNLPGILCLCLTPLEGAYLHLKLRVVSGIVGCVWSTCPPPLCDFSLPGWTSHPKHRRLGSWRSVSFWTPILFC